MNRSIAVSLVASAAVGLACGCSSTPPAPAHRLVVRALIDGSDFLNVRGDAIWWSHVDFELPGTKGSVREPTYLNDIEWRPDWSNGKVSSSASFSPPIPSTMPMELTVTPLHARWHVTVTQTPEPTNDYTLMVFFDDSLLIGAEWYEIAIEWK